MRNEISNSDDIIDSRDVIARIAELETELEGSTFNEEDEITASADGETDLSDEAAELKTLRELQEEAQGYAPDWQYGATLIRESYWVDYVQELLQDIGGISYYVR
jgi:hypothetical protein